MNDLSQEPDCSADLGGGRRRRRPLRRPTRLAALALVLLAGALAPIEMAAQQVQTAADSVISVQRGSSAIITVADTLLRVSVADPAVAEAVVIPPRQLVVNAASVGSTSLILWGRNEVSRLYTVEVTADLASLQRQLRDLFPDVDIVVSSTGTAVVLSGTVRDAAVVRRVLELAESTGAQVVNNIQAPSPEQILLHVQFAEVTRSAMKEIGGQLIRATNPARFDEAFDENEQDVIETLSEGFVNLTLQGETSRIDAIIRLLKSTGDFRSLAEPNLIARESEPASFLAGGEFPFPSIQGTNANAITVTWKEFGIRLNFVPTVTNSGNIRLRVSPEVSQLDFANGLQISGFLIPSLRTRRVDTDVELAPGQTLAIGGLLDSRTEDAVSKIPILGDIPIIGTFFKQSTERQERTELLVLVRPHILGPDDPVPALPTGEAASWDWDGHIRDYFELLQREGPGR
ncbi:MAG: pilus assembly protein N-terminal domain-containing protein [Gemmatimonadetes bacterium]|nr:pilus assembly protein N-terminal domain-containing protein [Gemmatimonadota bacterium]